VSALYREGIQRLGWFEPTALFYHCHGFDAARIGRTIAYVVRPKRKNLRVPALSNGNPHADDLFEGMRRTRAKTLIAGFGLVLGRARGLARYRDVDTKRRG
jgi:hypothetical protein